MRRFLTLVCLAVPVMSQAIVIDDFTVPYSRTISSGTWVDYQTDPTLFTGERDVQMEIQMDSSGSSTLSVGNGMLSLVNDPLARSNIRLQYDGIGDEIGNTGQGKVLRDATNPTNPFPQGANKVRFHVESNNLQIVVGFQLLAGGVVQFINSRTVLAGGYKIVDVPLSPSAFARCDSIIVQVIASRQGANAYLSRIEVVPEPIGGTGLAAGVVLFGIAKVRGRVRS